MADSYFYVYVLVTMPVTVLFFFFLVSKFKVGYVIQTLDLNNSSDQDRLQSFLQLLDFYFSDSFHAQNQLRRIQYSHALRCKSYGHDLDKRLARQSKR